MTLAYSNSVDHNCHDNPYNSLHINCRPSLYAMAMGIRQSAQSVSLCELVAAVANFCSVDTTMLSWVSLRCFNNGRDCWSVNWLHFAYKSYKLTANDALVYIHYLPRQLCKTLSAPPGEHLLVERNGPMSTCHKFQPNSKEVLLVSAKDR